MKTIAFVALAWLVFVWAGGMFVIIHFGWSPWWVLLLFALSTIEWDVRFPPSKGS